VELVRSALIGTLTQYSGRQVVRWPRLVHCSLRERFLSDHCVDRVTGRRKGATDGGIWAHRRTEKQTDPPQKRARNRPTAEDSEEQAHRRG
jgi:hypothetical protein